MDLTEDPNWKNPNESSSKGETYSEFYGTRNSDEDHDCPTKHKRKFPRFHSEKEGEDPKFIVGELFPTVAILKKTITQHGITYG